MSWTDTGALRRHLPRTADFAWFSNEDLGWTASLVHDTNDVLANSYPYVASIDLFEETMTLHEVETIFLPEIGEVSNPANGEEMDAIRIYYSMLKKDFGATFNLLNDTNDEAAKTKLGGPNFAGQHFGNPIATSNTGMTIHGDTITHDRWTPPMDMRLRTPMFFDYETASKDVTVATGATTTATNDNFEEFASRAWWSPSRLRRSERFAIRDIIKYQLIDT